MGETDEERRDRPQIKLQTPAATKQEMTRVGSAVYDLLQGQAGQNKPGEHRVTNS